jgi:hypothetical protein
MGLGETKNRHNNPESLTQDTASGIFGEFE